MVCLKCEKGLSVSRIELEKNDFSLEYDRLSRIKSQIEVRIERFKNALNNKNVEYEKLYRLRQELSAYFSKYDEICRALCGEPSTSHAQQRLQKKIRQATVQYLQENMFTLESLPKEKNSNSSMVDILYEQKASVEEQISNAIKHRRLEDAQILRLNLKELENEITRQLNP